MKKLAIVLSLAIAAPVLACPNMDHDEGQAPKTAQKNDKQKPADAPKKEEPKQEQQPKQEQPKPADSAKKDGKDTKKPDKVSSK
jgi:hypothetical protein